MATGKIIVIRESDFTVVGEVSSALLSGTGHLAINLDTSDKLYAAMQPGNFVVIDVTDPTAPTISGSISAQAELVDPTAIMYNSGYVYVAGSDDVSVSRIDITVPATPVLDDTLDYASFANVIDLEPLGGGFGAAACESTDSIVVATIDAVYDELIDATYFNGLVAMDRDVAGVTVYAVATTSQRLTSVDVSDRADISVIGSLSNAAFANATDVAVAGDYAYVSTSTGSIIIVNIADPSDISLVGTYSNAAGIGTATRLIEVDGVVYVVDSAGNLVEIDFTSTELVNYGEYPLEFDGDYNTDSRLHLTVTGPATILAVTYEVDDTDNPPANGG